MGNFSDFIVPNKYVVDIYRGKNILTSIEVITTSEEEAVAKAVKQINTKVRRI
jgi:hypothetical protein